MISITDIYGHRRHPRGPLRRHCKSRKIFLSEFLSDFPRPAIPFLAYPSTYYQEITNSSYNWIPASTGQNDLIRLKLAKYSPTGEFLGLLDAFDAIIQLCGGAYTDGQPAFTFGTQYQRTVRNRDRRQGFQFHSVSNPR